MQSKFSRDGSRISCLPKSRMPAKLTNRGANAKCHPCPCNLPN